MDLVELDVMQASTGVSATAVDLLNAQRLKVVQVEASADLKFVVYSSEGKAVIVLRLV